MSSVSSMPNNSSDPYAGKRIRLLSMPYDPDPLPVGSTGTVMFTAPFAGHLSLTVDWDNKRSLSLIVPPDRFEVIEDE